MYTYTMYSTYMYTTVYIIYSSDCVSLSHPWPHSGEQSYIAIGVCQSAYPANLLPGWEPTSVAFHMDQGGVFSSSDDPVLETSPCKTGDVVVCALLPCAESPEKGVIAFHRNAEKVAEVTTDVPPGGLHGCVGMMSKGERVCLSPPRVVMQLDFKQLWVVASRGLVAHMGGGACSYTGRGDFQQDTIGTVRSREPINLRGYYMHERSFELRILDTGEKSYIAMGVCSKTYPENLLPGWQKVSVGYHADNGQLFHSSSEGLPTPHTCRTGDVMRCCVDAVDGNQVRVSFFKNSAPVGSRALMTPDDGLYMCFGMMSRGERVQVTLPKISKPLGLQSNFHDLWSFPNVNFLLQENGLCVYTGAGGAEHVGTIRSRNPIDPFSSNNYFEVKIVDPGVHCYIALGVCSVSYPRHIPPGWQEVSVGFNAESGLILHGSREEIQTRHLCHRGDVLRCEIQLVDGAAKQVHVNFFKNGEFVGRVFLWVPPDGLHALVSCMSLGEVVQLACPEMRVSTLLPSQGQRDHASSYTRELDPVTSRAQQLELSESAGSQSHSRTSVEPGMELRHTGLAAPHEGPPGVGVAGMEQKFPAPSAERSEEGPARRQAHENPMPYGYEPPPGTELHSLPPYAYQPPGHRPHVPHPHMPRPRVPHPHVPHPHMPHPHMPHPGGYPPYHPAYPMYPHPPHLLSDRERYMYPHQVPFHHPMYPAYGMYQGYANAPPPGGGYFSAEEYGSYRYGARPGANPDPQPPPPHYSYHSAPAGATGPVPPPVDPHLPAYHRSSSLPFTSARPHVNYPPYPVPDRPTAHPASGAHIQELGPKVPLTEDLYKTGVKGKGADLPSVSSLNATPTSKGADLPSVSSLNTSPTSKGAGLPTAGELLHADEKSKGADLPTADESSPFAAQRPFHSFSSPAIVGGDQQATGGDATGKAAMAKAGASTVASSQLASPWVGRPHKDYSKGEEKPRFVGYDFPDESRNEPSAISLEGGRFVQELTCAVEVSDTVGACPPVESRGAAPHKPVDTLPKQPSPPTIPPVSLPPPRVIPRSENKVYRILHNVESSDDGSFSCPFGSHPSLVQYRLATSEKMPYFELSLDDITRDSNVAIGLVTKAPPTSSQVSAHSFTLTPVAYHSASGALHVEGVEGRSLSVSCVSGDVIGCKTHLVYKAEALTNPLEEDTGNVRVEFFRNGVSIGTEAILLPPDGLYPTVAIWGHGTKVTPHYNITLHPEKYFDTHPIPEGYHNFPPLPPVTEAWNCAMNSQVEEETFVKVADTTQAKPAVVQSILPFTELTSYFEAELLCPTTAYSLLALGVLPKIPPESKEIVPGEAPNSVGFLPLLGIVMRNNVMCSSIPSGATYAKKTLVGIGINYNPRVSSASPDSVSVFFTVNGQQLSSVLISLPPGGFFPTIAIDPDRFSRRDRLVALDFSKPHPLVKGLPPCFARGDPQKIIRNGPMLVLDEEGRKSNRPGTPVRMLQAAFPLSHSWTYFEVRIILGGENFCFSCGLASYDYPTDKHPGWKKSSVAFHVDDSSIHHNGEHRMVAPACQHHGVVVGCGARFPPDGSSHLAEVFFTIDGVMVARRLTPIPPVGFFPTVGMSTLGGAAEIDLRAPDPFPDLQFVSMWAMLDNVHEEDEGLCVQLKSQARPGFAQLASPASADKVTYFNVSPGDLNGGGSISIGFSSPGISPFSPRAVFEGGSASYGLEILSGGVYLKDRHSNRKETCLVEDGLQFGCGIKPLPNKCGLSSNGLSLLFFTVDNRLVYCTTLKLQDCSEPLQPFLHIMESKAKLSVDATAMWPPRNAMGIGWAQYSHLALKDSAITLDPTGRPAKANSPLGYCQAATPLIPSSPYFEVEVCSQGPTNCIAIGLASKNYRGDSLLGFKNRTIAFNLSDGKIYNSQGYVDRGQPVPFKLQAGDTIGCGIRFTSQNHSTAISCVQASLLDVYFTLNGAIIGRENTAACPGGIFPTICIFGPSESVIFHQRSEFPPVANYVGHEWRSAFTVRQAGNVLQHTCRDRSLSKVSRSVSFCQAREQLSPDRCYFEIEIIGCSDPPQIAAGVAPAIPRGTPAPQFDSILYNCMGQLVERRGPQRETRSGQRCGLGDRLGCAVLFACEGEPEKIEFYVNSLKVMSKGITQEWREQHLFPTIVLPFPGDAVVPRLSLPLPTWDRSLLVGWLRSERVRLRNNIVEYTGSGTDFRDVGVAQVSQTLQVDTLPYFEVEVLSLGARSTIAVGGAPADYSLNKQPGWERDSIGYHGDDGCLFHENRHGSVFGPTWKCRDVIGMGIRAPDLQDGSDDLPTEVQAFFTRNGEELGHTTIRVPHTGLFPTIGVHSPGEAVKISFHSTVPCNSSRASKAWRTICGLKMSRAVDAEHGASFTLSHWENSHQLRETGMPVAIAIGAHPFSETMQYCEAEVLAYGRLKAVGIGAVPSQYSIEHMPGWDPNSVAYHTDNGELYCSSGKGKVFGPVARIGDVLGCGVSFIPNNTKHCSIFFTYNGCEIGRQRTIIPPNGLYPAVGLASNGDKVKVRFKNTFKPRVPQSELSFIGLMQIHNCSYSNQVVQFTGGGSSGVSSAPAMAQFAVPLHHSHNYFLANLIRCNDAVLIGLAVRDYPIKYAPGYTSVSVAYDTSRGIVRAVYASNNIHMFDNLPKCTVGDCVGCGIETQRSDPKDERAFIFFTKNGTLVKQVELVDVFEDLYPIVGMVPDGRKSAVFMDWNTPVYVQPNVF